MGDFDFDEAGIESTCQIDEDYLLKEIKKIRDGNQDRRKDWASLTQVLSTAISLSLDSCSILRSALTNVILHLLSEQKLVSVWTAIVNTYLLNSKVTAQKDAQQVTNEHRVVSNFYRDSRDFPIDAIEYRHCVIHSILRYVNVLNLNDDKDELTALSAIFVSLTADFQAYFMDCICDDPTEGMVIVDYLPSDFVLDATYQLFRRKFSGRRQRSSSSKEESELSSNEMMFFQKLIERSLVDCYPITVIDALLMQKPFSCSVAHLVVDALPESSYPDLLDMVGSLWGEKIFVSSGKDEAQEYLTEALICTLQMVTGKALSHRGRHGIPIASILSAGVSVYLDQSDRRSRIRGMKVAREFSVLMGHHVEFQELLEEEKRLQLLQSAPAQTSNAAGDAISCPSSSVSSAKGRSRGLLSSRGFDSEIDTGSDSEIEGYDCPDESPEDFLPLTNYLRDCLELLLASDADKDAHDKQLAALKSIPRIVSTDPVDDGDVCGPLVKELLRLNNNFNMDNFDGLVESAVQSLLVAYPLIAAPVLSWAVEEESFSISMRIFAITSLSKGAFSLSGMLKSGQTPSLTALTAQQEAERSKNEIEDETNAISISSGRKDSTTVKRPLKLAADARKKVYIVNKFGPVGPLFFYPILRRLAVTISKNNSNEIEKEKKKQMEKASVSKIISFTSEEDSFEDTFIRNSLAAKTKAKNGRNGKNGTNGKNGGRMNGGEESSDAFDGDVGDGLQSMIPVEALLALASFVRCSLNSTCQSTFTMETMKAAFIMKDSSSLAVRRASLTALCVAFESWLGLKSRRKSGPPGTKGLGVLESLSDITGEQSRMTPKGEVSPAEQEEYSIVVTIVDWAVATSKTDADESCRGLKREVIRIAIEAFGLLEGDNHV